MSNRQSREIKPLWMRHWKASSKFSTSFEIRIVVVDQLSMVFSKPPPDIYGDPLTQNVISRYAFWPSNKGKLPLLFLVACVILVIPATSTPNESLHSIIGIILRKHRSCLSDDNAQHYTLLRAILPSIIENNASLSAMSSALDWQELDPDAVIAAWEGRGAAGAEGRL